MNKIIRLRYHRLAALSALIIFALTAGPGLASDAMSGKITAVYFFKPDCIYCAKFEGGPLKDPAVKKELSTLNWTQVNSTSEAPIDYLGAKVSQTTLVSKYGINLAPTVIFVTPDGKALANIRGLFETPDFLEMVKYVTEGHYEKETMEAYLGRKAKGE